VLTNLLSNAVKFTSQGRVVVRAQYADGALRVDVIDTGDGMDAAVQARLFHRFVQGDSSTARRFGGTGLGLAICRQLVELMGGTIGVSSAVGAGSTFTFSVPATVAASPSPPLREVRCASAPALRILGVDDHPINRRLMLAYLGKGPHWVRVAEDGPAALAALDSESFDVVLMDIEMPGMDGPACLQRIRARPDAMARVPVVAVTAHAMAGDRERYLAAGFDDYLAKPMTRTDLEDVLQRVCPGAAGLERVAAAS
jgi:two-component system, sensor histidine kinase